MTKFEKKTHNLKKKKQKISQKNKIKKHQKHFFSKLLKKTI